MKKVNKLLGTALALTLMLCIFALPAAADSALTVLNDCSDPSQFTGQAGLIYGASSDSPDGKALEIEYEYGLTFNLKSNVAKEQRAADADKQYLCFWIKTPYSECDSGIFVGLKEEDTEGNIDMIWNGNEAGYKGNIITVDKNGNKSYVKAGRLLVLKPGFEGYVAIPLQTGLARHPGWGNEGDKVFDFAKIDEIQIWFDGSHAAYDEKYAFDNFMLAADESAFVNMVTATGLTVKDVSAQTPTNSSEQSATTSDVSSVAPSSDVDTTSSVISETSSVSNESEITNTDNDYDNKTNTDSSSDSASNGWLYFIIILIVVLLAAAVAIIFIYKPKFIFKNKTDEAVEKTDE